MKIKEINIQNFGKLSNYTLNFDDGLTTIVQENGWGKTTLTEFIKAMFYGFSQTTKQKISENPFKRYTPWQGGVFGGSIVFTFKGKDYKLIRLFGKSGKDQTYELYDLKTNKLLDEYPSGKSIKDNPNMLGFELFGINAEGFMRSLFINQTTLENKDSDDIKERLNNLLGNTDDTNNLKSAVSKLTKRRSELKNNQKRGVITDTENDLNELKKSYELLKISMKQHEINLNKIEEIKHKISETEKEAEKIDKSLLQFQKVKEKQLIKENLDSLQQKIQESEIELRKYKLVFNNKEPKQEDINKLDKALKERDDIEKRIFDINHDISGGEEFDKIKSFFKGQYIIKEEIDALFSLNEKFTAAIHMREKELALENAKGVSNANNTPNKKIGGFVLLGLALVLILIGLFIVTINITVGIAFLIIAVMFLVFGVHNIMLKKDNHNKSNDDFVNSLNNEINAYKQKITEKLVHYFDNIDKDVKSFNPYITELQIYKTQYDKIIENKNQNSSKLEELKDAKKSLDFKVSELLSDYQIDNYNSDMVIRYLTSSFDSYNFHKDMVIKTKKEYEDYKNNYKEDGEKLTTTESYEELSYQKNQINNKLDYLKAERVKIDTENHVIENEIALKSDIEEDIILVEEKLKKLEHEFKMLEYTEKLLIKSEENITSRYLKPLHEEFKKYTNLMLYEDIGNFMLNTDLDLKVERFGANVSVDYFSSGYKDILELAMRLSLINIMFKDEKPFIILDDPFVYLDDKKMGYMLDLLNKLSKDIQIIYLTCHSSRKK